MLILASASPRRRRILEITGLPFQVEVADVDETSILDTSRQVEQSRELNPGKVVQLLAEAKAQAVFKHHSNSTVIGADTIVVLGEKILGKPENIGEARAMLHSLSGKIHQVYTGVAILQKTRKYLFFDTADVEFNPLDEYQKAGIEAYISSGKCFDKAGAYGIQDEGALLLKGIQGDFYTVRGLPLAPTRKALFNLGYNF